MVRDYKQEAYNQSVINAQHGAIHPVLTCARLTRKCNIKCDYCSEIYVPTGPDLDFDDWKLVFDIVYNLGNRDFVITGGEPLLKRYVADLVAYTASRDSFVSIATNGYLLGQDSLSKLDSAGLDFLCISIDYMEGYGKREFGKKLSQKMKLILKRISERDYGFETQISTVVTRHNMDELPEMVAYFSSLGIPTKLMIMMVNDINQEATKNLYLKDETEKIKELSHTLQKMKREGALLIDDDFALERLTQFFSGKFTYNCNGGVFDLSLNNDGRLVVCPNGVISPTTIFDLTAKEEYERFIARSKPFTDNCPGCLWSHKQRLEEIVTKRASKNIEIYL